MAESYNGYKNYCTWAVKLWLDNQESTYKYFRSKTQEIKEEYQEESDRKYYLSELVKEFTEENAPDISASVYSDLLSYAMSEVDFYEVAEQLLEESEE